MKNVEIDGRKVRMQVVTITLLSGTLLGKTGSGQSHPPITRELMASCWSMMSLTGSPSTV